MQKIPSLFLRNNNNDSISKLVLNMYAPDTEWVRNGEGVATQKLDGTACLVKDKLYYKRASFSKHVAIPKEFVPAQLPDPHTGVAYGWMPIDSYNSADKWHMEAINASYKIAPWQLADGTYELCGPKINNNREYRCFHTMERHGEAILYSVPTGFENLRDYFTEYNNIEGVVWHHPDGRMVKIKGSDFGVVRAPD